MAGNIWEGSVKYFNREVSVDDQRSDPKMIYPIADFDHTDPTAAAGWPRPPASTCIARRRCRS
jgi:hypothetical protein